MFDRVMDTSLVSSIQHLSRNADNLSKKRGNFNKMGGQDSANQFDFEIFILISGFFLFVCFYFLIQ